MNIKEFIRKKIVSLKRNPSMIPLTMLLVSFLVYSLNLTAVSNTTAKIQGPNMGLAQFTIMLLSILGMVCMLNAFHRRKKANIPMIVLLFAMIGIVVFCDMYYTNAIWAAVTRATSPIVIDTNTQYILQAYNLLRTHVVLMIISALLVATLPIYSKLLKKINTAVDMEDNGAMAEIELTD